MGGFATGDEMCINFINYGELGASCLPSQSADRYCCPPPPLTFYSALFSISVRFEQPPGGRSIAAYPSFRSPAISQWCVLRMYLSNGSRRVRMLT